MDEKEGGKHAIIAGEDSDVDAPDSGADVHATAKPHAVKPSVHYSDGITGGPVPGFATEPVRLDSAEDYAPKAPSLNLTDDDFDVEDYDWSTDDDLVDEGAKKFEQQMGGKQKRSKFMKIMAFFLSSLVGSVITSGVIVAAAVLVNIFYYKHSNDSNREHRKYVTENIEAWLFWAAANLLISWFLAFLINVVPGILTWTVFIVWGQISESMKNRVELYNSTKDTFKPVFYAATSWASWLIIFSHIFKLYDRDDKSASVAPYTTRVYQAVEFVFFLVLVWCGQRMLSQMIAFAFHKMTFKDRTDSLKLSLKTIQHLKNYKPRHHRSSKMFSGFSTPISRAAFGFGSGGGTPFTEKPHFTAPEPHSDGHAGNSQNNTASSKKGKGKQKQKHTRIKTASGTFTPNSDSNSPADALQSYARFQTEGGTDTPNSGPDSTANAPQSHLTTTSTDAHTDAHSYPPGHSPVEGSKSPQPGTSSRRSSESEDEHAILHAAKALKSAVLHDARNITGNGDDGTMTLGWGVSSPQEAKRIARSIYQAFRQDRRRNYLIAEDFDVAYATHEQAEEAFRVFDTDNNGDISRAEIKTAVIKAYQERRFLARSMRDVSTALRSLDQVLLFFAFVILFFISLSVFGVNITKSLTSVYTVGIAASFIFRASASNMFDAVMFLFVTHPFDTGDRCFIDEDNLVVKKMGLFATVFSRADGTETYYFNSQLFTKFITNARRSGKTTELCTLQVAWRTPLEKIDELEKRINDWLSTEENRWFEPNTSITLQKIENQRYLEISIGIPHNGQVFLDLAPKSLLNIDSRNWQDWGLRNTRKTAFFAAANYYARQLGIQCTNSPMPIVYANGNNTRPRQTSSPASASSISLDAPDEPGPADEGELKPMLGFLPPRDKRSSKLLRARKSKGRKDAFRAMDGGG